jgi:hypothetical protein
MKRILVLLSVLLTSLGDLNARETGIEFLRGCGATVKQADGVAVTVEESIESIWCVGYLSGFADALRLSATFFEPQNQGVCLPEKGVSNEQLARVVTKWLKNHPESLHQSGRTEIMLALGEAFPCN